MSNNKPRSVYACLSTLTIGFLSSALVLPAILLWSRCAIAQVTSDGTTNTIVNPNGNNFTILNGIQKGNNLFHSFSNFSVPTGGSARFDLINTPNIATIFSRVTGGNVSNIDGLIQTLNNNNPVSLFLMNPAGIVFGPNASLNIGGSFVGTTANSIKFADGTEFSAVNPTEKPLLTISVPIGLQMGSNAGSIEVQGAQPPNSASGLQVKTGQTLALVGGQIDMSAANLSSPDGRIELWALQNGEVAMNAQPWQLTSSAATANWGTITLQQTSLIDASGINGGAINIRGSGLTLQDGSNIKSSTSARVGQSITVQTTEFVDLLGISGPGQEVLSGIHTSVENVLGVGDPATGRAGNIIVETRRFQALNTGWLQSSTSGNNSQTGDITVKAVDIILNGYSRFGIVSAITNLTLFGNNNKAGQITIDAARISLIDGGRISSDMISGSGSTGDISIHATESFKLQGVSSQGLASAVLSSLQAGSTGQGGQITIDAGSLVLSNGGAITTGLSGPGTNRFGSFPGTSGTAGNITIRAKDVQVSDPVSDGFSGANTGITVSVANGATGQGGNINLTADNLRVFNGGQITSSNLGQGLAGSINLQAKNIDVQGISPSRINGQLLPSAITASSDNAFAAGSVNITANLLQVRDGAQITVSNTGSGDAGNLNVTAGNLFLDKGASLRAEVNGGNQGNINLTTNEVLLLRHGSNITTNAQGASTGGNININAAAIVGLANENSDIVANAILGSGGNINITTQTILGLQFRPQLTPQSDITASSQFGLSGTVEVNTIGTDLSSGLVELPANITDTSQQIASGCSANQGSSFVATGRGGIPQNPTQDVRSDVYDGLRLRTWADIRDISAYRKTQKVQAQIPPTPEVLVQATFWHRNAQGKIELVADKSPTQVQQPLTCAALRKI
ncbi:MAG: S-layer family protein [Nostoc sp.]